MTTPEYGKMTGTVAATAREGMLVVSPFVPFLTLPLIASLLDPVWGLSAAAMVSLVLLALDLLRRDRSTLPLYLLNTSFFTVMAIIA